MGLVQAPFFLLCSKECRVARLMELAQKAFSCVTFIPDGENLQSNWHEKGDHPKSAAGPNSLFRQAAWHFSLKQLGPWFFLEPDAVPCRRDWYEMLTREYQIGGKPFMGYRVTPQNHPGVPDHLSGVAVYPENTPNFRNLVFPSDVAFDIAGVEHTMAPNAAHYTQVIYHKYRADGFTSEEDFNARVPAHVAVWHACKDGSIYPFLSARHGLSHSVAGVPVSGLTVTSAEEPVGHSNRREAKAESAQRSVGSNPTACDIFIKTRPHDYPWLEWCIKSIGQFADGFRRAILKSPSPIPSFGYIEQHKETLSPIPDKEPGYLWQQVCKLHADEHTDAEWILFMDSDCVFTRPVSPSGFIHDGKPIWLYTPLDQARPDQHVWAPVMEKFLGRKPQHEFMRRHPFIVQRWMLEEFRKFCQYRHGKSLEEYIMGEADPGNNLALKFSEWNCLGFFLWEYHRDKVAWFVDSKAGTPCIYQGFTHGGEQRKQEDLAKFKELLAGQPEEGNIASGVAPDGTKVTSSVAGGRDLTVSSAISFLASQVKDNFHKARIIRDLKKAWKGKGEAPKTRSRGASAPKNGYSLEPSVSIAEIAGAAAKIHGWNKGTLLCIHSYPGANDTVARHWRSYEKFGADRIVGIGTLDNKTTFPCESVNIGEDGYMKLKGKDDHLCRRLLDTVKWCLTQPEDRFAIIEYDTIPLRKMPKWKGVNASLTGGKVNDSKARSFYHNPWLFDRAAGEKLVCALEAVLPESAEYPNNSPDLFFGLACERAGIRVECKFTLFTRNSLDAPGDLDLAVEAAVSGAHVVHGVKEAFEYDTIMNALNGKHLALSHA